jgi:uncharacterized protein YndB with AHSA1/START domain
MMSDKNSLAALVNAPTRRQAIAGVAAAFGGLVVGATRAWAGTEEEISHTAEAIHMKPVFKASRKRVYEVLTDTRQFEKVTQLGIAMTSGMSLGTKPTEISREVGGAFSIFRGHILGRHIELVPNQRIVQVWRVADWDPGVYSIAKFELMEQGSGTKIVFDHSQRASGTSGGGMERELLGATGEISSLSIAQTALDAAGDVWGSRARL